MTVETNSRNREIIEHALSIIFLFSILYMFPLKIRGIYIDIYDKNVSDLSILK